MVYVSAGDVIPVDMICTTLSPLDVWTDPAEVMELLARWRDKQVVHQKRDDRTPTKIKSQWSGY